jgi:hypothetical protein
LAGFEISLLDIVYFQGARHHDLSGQTIIDEIPIIGVTDWIVDGTASEGKFAKSEGTGEYGWKGRAGDCANWNAVATRCLKCFEKSYQAAKPVPIEPDWISRSRQAWNTRAMFPGAGRQRTQAVSDGVCAIEARSLLANFKLCQSRTFRAFNSDETKEYASRFERRIFFGLAIGEGIDNFG